MVYNYDKYSVTESCIKKPVLLLMSDNFMDFFKYCYLNISITKCLVKAIFKNIMITKQF